MKQVHPPASLVLLVLLPRSKAPLAALFVLEGSLDRWRYPHVGWVPPNKKTRRNRHFVDISHPWKPGDLASFPGDLGGFRHRFRSPYFETKKPLVLLMDQEGAFFPLAGCFFLEICLVGEAMGSIGKCMSGWWFQNFFMFTPIWGRSPVWLIFFRWGETTNYRCLWFFFWLLTVQWSVPTGPKRFQAAEKWPESSLSFLQPASLSSSVHQLPHRTKTTYVPLVV